MSGVKPPVDLLDNRAATYAKLDRLKPALRDARRMIEQDKSNSTGYLRTGSILQSWKQPEKALEVFQLGLRRVAPDDPNMISLRGSSDRLSRQCAPTKARDPFQVLPAEIVDMIISFMSFSQIVCLLRISRSWRDLLSSIPRLWTELNFSNSRKNVSMTAVRRYVQNAHGTCSALVYHRSGSGQENIVDYVASRCRGLKAIRLSSESLVAPFLKADSPGSNLRVLILTSHCKIANWKVSRLLDQCVNLERAEFHSIAAGRPYTQTHDLSKMHTLVMNVAQGGHDALHFANLLAQAAQLRSLSLRNWDDCNRMLRPLDFSKLSKLEDLDIRNVRTNMPPGLPPSMRHLCMTGCRAVERQPVEVSELYKSSTLPNLSTLYVGHSSLYDQFALMQLITANKKSLRAVDLSGKPFDDQVSNLIRSNCLDIVERLMLEETAVNDDGVLLIVQKLRHIKHLDLARTHVTGVGVKALITGFGGQLRWLRLDECTRTSIDAVELARSKGVYVSYDFPDPKGSKKVRQ